MRRAVLQFHAPRFHHCRQAARATTTRMATTATMRRSTLQHLPPPCSYSRSVAFGSRRAGLTTRTPLVG
eukprot:10685716-Alexandrium_andersonii.AAC.1